MPWRLILLIVVLAILLGFIGFNLDNTCDLSFGFKVFKGVPVYLTVFISFILGLISSLPFFFLGSLKKKLKNDKTSNSPKSGGKRSIKEKPGATNNSGPYGIN